MENKLRAVILGAGKPHFGTKHAALVSSGNGPVLDWLLKTISVSCSDVQFIGGYKAEEITKNYQQLTVVNNDKWETTGAVGSLFLCDHDVTEAVLVCYADVLFREDLVRSVERGTTDIVIAVDSLWKQRFLGRSISDLEKAEKVVIKDGAVLGLGRSYDADVASAEFVGLVKFSPKVWHYIKHLPLEKRQRLGDEKLSILVEFLRLNGFSVSFIDAQGDWAEVRLAADLGQFILGTKAETLHRLKKMVRNSVILDQISFTLDQWVENSGTVIDEILNKYEKKKIIVRSSAKSEDNKDSSGAGVYDSVMNVPTYDLVQIKDAINQVFNSYGDSDGNNQILIQEMINDVSCSGVIVTETLATGRPYYVINYDDTTGTTDSVTNGLGRDTKIYKVFKYLDNYSGLPRVIAKLLISIKEVENLLGSQKLDIEFAINQNGTIFLLQVRHLAANNLVEPVDVEIVRHTLTEAQAHFASLSRSHPSIAGDLSGFGSMPDWNPAEIIGTRPSQLSVDLYRYLIMDETWAQQRFEYGYRDLRGHRLLKLFNHQPYVDIKASLNSFIPANLDDDLASKLIDSFISRLKQIPSEHDKIEFNIVPTCYSLDFDIWRTRLEKSGFTQSEILAYERSLLKLTNNAISQRHQASDSIKKLIEKREKVLNSEVTECSKAFLLLADAKIYGTLAFAHLARDAFVAITLLKSGVNTGALSSEAYDSFLMSLNTVSSSLSKDASSVKDGKLDFNTFVKEYGHLRPNTYEISSKNYKSDVDTYLKPLVQSSNMGSLEENSLNPWNSEKVNFFNKLQEKGLKFEHRQFEQFLKTSIEGREYSKFEFTKNLSAVLDIFALIGENFGFDISELEYSSLNAYEKLYIEGDEEEFTRRLKFEHKLNKAKTKISSNIDLPPLLFDQNDFTFHKLEADGGNFIGNNAVTADVIQYELRTTNLDLKNKIVMIESADPGYDWLFSVGISALITKYGGANSHMAIRAAEFGLPAVIGVGELTFDRIKEFQRAYIDCKNTIIREAF